MKLYTLDNQFIEKIYYFPDNFTGIAEFSNGSKAWYFEGKYHRLDGPAFECSDGTKFWYIDGKRHRLDGPAYVGVDGTKAWYVNGVRHRLDGSAIEYVDGGKEWYVDDKQVTEEQHTLLVDIMKLKGFI